MHSDVAIKERHRESSFVLVFFFFFRVFKWYLLLLVGLDTQAWVFV